MTDLTVRDQALGAATSPLVVAPGVPLRDVARLLWEAGVGAAIVADERDVRGVISERDLVTQIAHGADLDLLTANQAMTRTVVSARPDDPLLDVVFLMIDTDVRHIPVVDENGHVDGMVSIRDLLRPLLVATFGGTPTSEQEAAS